MERQIKVASDGKLVEEEINGDNMRMTSKADPDSNQVYNPPHYQSYIKDGIDCITAMQHAFGIEATATFCKLNSFKYLWRASSKGGNESISKAQWYLNKYLELGGENL